MDADRVRRWREELGDLRVAETVVATRSAVVQPVDDELADDHLRAMLAEQARPATAQPITADTSLAPMVDWLRRRLSVPAATTTVAAALALVLAVAGSLPDSAQRLVADLAGTVGIELPRPELPGEHDGGSLAPDRSDAELIGSLTHSSVTDSRDDTSAPDGDAASAALRATEFGASDGAPGRADAASGRSEQVPGIPDDAAARPSPVPVRADDAPGRSGDAPGRADDPPGRADEAPGRSQDPPGRSGGGSGGDDGPADASQGASQDAPGKPDHAGDGSDASPGASQDAPGSSDDSTRWARSSGFGTASVTDVPDDANGHGDGEANGHDDDQGPAGDGSDGT